MSSLYAEMGSRHPVEHHVKLPLPVHLVGVTGDLEAVDRECTNGLVVQVEAEVRAAQQLCLVSIVLIHLECHVEEVQANVCHFGNGAHAQ